MTALSLAEAKRGKPPKKYHGKWPFRRVLGAQELCSALLSLANLIALLSAHRSLEAGWRSIRASTEYPFMWLWRAYCAVSCNAWVWSCVFHTRDTYLTERLDYAAADASVAFSLLASIVRTTGTRHPGRWAAGLAAGLAVHQAHMLFVKFDYGWNMTLCLAASGVQVVLWVVWLLRNRHPARGTLLAFLILLHGCMLFEVLDFPPLGRLLDAHAVWHLCTIPLVFVWYRFLRLDAASPGYRLKRDQ